MTRFKAYDDALGLGWESRVSKNLRTVVKWHCKMQKISVNEFARRCGIKGETLRDSMNCRAIPNVAIIAIVSLNTGVPVGYFFRGIRSANVEGD